MAENQPKNDDLDKSKKVSDETSADDASDSFDESDEDILRVAHERFKLCEEAETSVRAEAIDDERFLAGRQWHEQIKKDRETECRPVLVINRLAPTVRQVTNDQRQNRPSIKIAPIDDKATEDTAKIFQGLIRNIEYNSNADLAYDTAFEGAVGKSFGFYRILTDYISPNSFDQEILIKAIRNAFSAYLDPNSKEPDGSDANFGFIFSDLQKDDYEAEYGDSDLCSQMSEWTSIGNQVPNWASNTTCRVAEYFYKTFKKATLIQLRDGNVHIKEDIEKNWDAKALKAQIVQSRPTVIPVVKWCKINAIEVLEKKLWLGQWIPIIPVYGDIRDINGEVIRESLIRHSKDSQRMLNYMASAEAEVIALAPRAPFIVAEGQIPDEYKGQWETANTQTHAYLPYRPVSIDGTPVPPPTRNVYEAPVQAITNARNLAGEDIKVTTGVYDATLGNRSNETSGKAIERRNQQSQTGNFHFTDNLTRSIRHGGRQLVDLIPKIYDAERAERILGEDGKQEIVWLNKIFEHKGQQKKFDLSVGRYDVTIGTGPNYATKRQEAVASMLDLTRSYPQMAQFCADLMVKAMDWPMAEEVSERLRKMLPPQLQDDDKNQMPIPPQVKAQMQQMGQMIDQLTQHTKEMADDIKTEKYQLESKERIALMQVQADLAIAEMKVAPPEAVKLALDQIAHIKTRLEMLGIHDPVGDAQAQQLNQQGAGPTPSAPQHFQPQQPTGGLPPGPGQAPGPNMGG